MNLSAAGVLDFSVLNRAEGFHFLREQTNVAVGRTERLAFFFILLNYRARSGFVDTNGSESDQFPAYTRVMKPALTTRWRGVLTSRTSFEPRVATLSAEPGV